MSAKTVVLVITSPQSPLLPLARQYWELASDGQWAHGVQPLCKKAKLTQPRFLAAIKSICHVTIQNLVCKTCMRPHQVYSRSEWQEMSSIHRPSWQCWTCREAARSEFAAAEHEEKLRLLGKRGELTPASADSIGMLDAVCLIAISGREDSSPQLIQPILATDRPSLAPGHLASLSLTRQLFHKGLVVPTASCQASAVIIKKDSSGRVALNPQVVTMQLAMREQSMAEDFIARLDARVRSARRNHNDLAQLQEVAWLLARLECESYLYGQILVRKLDWRPDANGLQQIWSKILERYSVSQACYFIWRALADDAKDPAKSSSATFHRRLDRMVSHAIDDGWKIDGFERPVNSAQSTMSLVTFSKGFGSSGIDVGFYTRISEILQIFSLIDG